MFKDEFVSQAPGSDFTRTSLAVLKGAEELSTDNFFFTVDVTFYK